MEFSCSWKTMVVWCLIFLSLLSTDVPRVHGQLDSVGFISIDCGLPDNSTYVDATTKLPYSSDARFTDTGMNQNISAEYIVPTIAKQYLNVRSFDTGNRNCYTLRSLTTGLKYLVRATFMYGNYDGLNKLPIFDLHIGVNFWKTINITDAGSATKAEVITVAPADYLQVCLVNTGHGTPFISGLELRPLKTILYPAVNQTQSIVLVTRQNAGPTDNSVIRYPDDPHDRIWPAWSNVPYWTEITTTLPVQNLESDQFEAPSAVMQTAATPVNSSELQFYWTQDPGDTDPGYLAVFHFSELEVLTGNTTREFNITLNGVMWYAKPFSPEYLYSDAVFGANPFHGFQRYNASLIATSNSTLPPLLNALEIFKALSISQIPTDSGDVSAINSIKTMYQIKKNWNGDPCVPEAYRWDGLNCSYAISNPPRITQLNLASSGLAGDITGFFANLKALQYLDLSYNNLTGSIPDVLSQLPSLSVLDLTGNQLNGTIPASLLKKSQDGSLTLKIGGNSNLCANGNSCQLSKKKSNGAIIAIAIVIPIVVIVIVVAVIIILCRVRKRKGLATNITVRPQNAEYPKNNYSGNSLQLENRQFTYQELEVITNNFQRELGKGGFGAVYDGFLEDGTQVAVKLRSQSSSQGVREFLAEAQHLTRVHHKNLVSMIGYCKDGDYLALVYEYMSEGTLQEHLRGKGNSRPLSWRQRIRIALESAQGLEYLHKGCNPPLIHRDVKTNNILLDANLEAKIADFGLSKAFNNKVNTHISTNVVGTPGYVDPEYHMTFQITEKSDVYSFGIVLLEVVTGRPAIVPVSGPTSQTESINIVQWVRQRLARGNIESVVDPKMQGAYDVNSVWKAADVALKCTAQSAAQRPTMTEVVMQLKECLELENGGERGYNNFYSGNSSYGNMRSENYYMEQSDVSQNNTFEMEQQIGRVSIVTGPAAR